MKYVIVFSVFFLAINAYAVREVQNGGGGVRMGQTMETFFTANLRFDEDPEVPEKIPGLMRLIDEIESMPIKSSVKGILMAAVYPTMDRKYYRVKKGDISEKTRTGIRDQYAHMLKIPKNNVVVFAVSGPTSKITVLMEEFYTLKESEQAAILLHEGLWMISPGMTYEQVMNLEIDGQAYFQEHSNYAALYRFVTNLGDILSDRTLSLVTSLAIDLKSQILPRENGSTWNTTKLVDLVGERYLDCMILHEFSNYKSNVAKIDYVRSCNNAINYYAVMKATKIPRSYYYQALLVYMGRAGHVSLLNAFDESTYMEYGGKSAGYTEYRNSLYVNFEEPVAGNHMYLTIYDISHQAVGRIRF
ncbi:hypothetical protein ACLVWU_05840 [Bdellovibrio sp. HCB290]|uniref:hypothetical protein n=1 Tax=Bdellovibrio sp. HCB290 TaxID=3394356 RepID=UPI0039B65316